jgi:hypothetical protein
MEFLGKMKKEEFLKYFELCQGEETSLALDGNDKRLISEIRNHCFISMARIGQEYARAKDYIQKRYLVYKTNKDINGKSLSIDDANAMAEKDYIDNNEVSRRELEWLLEALKQGCNACASRLSVLGDEGRGV